MFVCLRNVAYQAATHIETLITEPETGNPRLMFYSLSDNKCALVQDMELPSAAYNELFWAPEGQYFVMVCCQRWKGGYS